MALVVEDGTIVSGANSYVSDAEFTAYCDARGFTYPATSGEREQLLIKAIDYIHSKRNQMQGIKVNETQPMQFPRSGVTIDGYGVDSNEIPQVLKDAQCQIAYELQSGSFMASGNSRAVKVEEVTGAVRVEYFGGSGSNVNSYKSRYVDSLLDVLMISGGGGLYMVRV